MSTDPFESAKVATFASRASFSGVPARPLDDLGDAGVVILGAPFDWGTTHRPGARFGPKAIRNADYLGFDGYRPHLPTGIDPLSTLKVVDAGDLLLPVGYIEESLDLISDAVGRIARHGAVPIVLGGDHSITFPNARAVAAVHCGWEPVAAGLRAQDVDQLIDVVLPVDPAVVERAFSHRRHPTRCPWRRRGRPRPMPTCRPPR